MSEPTLAASTRMSPRLAARHAARGRGALVETLVCHRAMLVKVAQGVTGCASRAEDVVHDVLLRLVDFPNQEAIRQPLAYVTRMVRNASIDVCRRQSLETHWHAEAEAGLDVPSPEPTPEAIALTRDALERMRAVLTEVPVRSRTAFEMVRVREETLAAARGRRARRVADAGAFHGARRGSSLRRMPRRPRSRRGAAGLRGGLAPTLGAGALLRAAFPQAASRRRARPARRRGKALLQGVVPARDENGRPFGRMDAAPDSR